MARTIVFNGLSFWFNGKDYFRNARGQLLHRVMWDALKGPIPRGHVVHHINEDKLDNRIENLTTMPRGDHVRMHGKRGWAVLGFKARSILGKRSWKGREPVTRACKWCRKKYKTRSTYSSWCGEKCRVAARYHGGVHPEDKPKS